MKMPPLWGLGYQQCRWSYYPDTEVLGLARTFREKQIPADVIYLDIHYMDAYKIFTWNPERFPQPKQMIDSLKAMGFHVVTIVDPGIKIEQGYFAYDEGTKNDLFIKYPNGSNYTGSVWPGRCHFPDFTKATAREWWGRSFSRLIEPGVEGFWNDMNEPAVWGQHIPDLVQLDFDGGMATMSEAHNIYGMEMARSTYEGTRSLMNGKRPFVLTRAGYAGIQRYSAVWTGDNVPSDDHMLLAVRLVNSMGLSGIAFAGPDIGGFSGDATPELFTRWLSIGTYTPFFRNHKQYGRKQQEPWSFGEEVEATSRQCIEQRYRLLPYLYSSLYETSQSGLPVQRSLAINYTDDERIYWGQYQHEYLFGDNILVAPVASAEKYADVYFPEGGWYRLTSEQFYQGDRSTIVEAPLNDLPVFVKAGGIIPMQSVVQHTSQPVSDTLQLHVYFGKGKNSFTYYEDDGLTYEYENGAYYKRLIAFDSKAKEIVLEQPEGTFKTKFSTINVVLHGFERVRNVSVNSKNAQVRQTSAVPNIANVSFQNSNSRIVISW
jgi:alpha-glucosidase